MTQPKRKSQTPITDQVRDEQGDYLAAVEGLEFSHHGLIKALKEITQNAYAMNNPGLHEYAVQRSIIEDAREVIKSAETWL